MIPRIGINGFLLIHIKEIEILSNTLLVYNTAVRNYYYTTKSSIIDKNWVLNEMNTKGQLVWKY